MKTQLSQLSKSIRYITAASLTASLSIALPATAQEESADADANVEKMALERKPINLIAPQSRASKAYQALWQEVKQLAEI